MVFLTTGVTLDAVRGFMNTVDAETGVDHLADAASFAAWLRDSRLAPGAGATGDRDRVADAGAAGDRGGSGVPDGPSGDDLVQARRLRDALRELARANHDGEVDADGTDTLNELAAAVGLTVRFTPDGQVELVSRAGGVAGVLAGIVAAVAVATADGTWQRVKLCANDECQWVFQDSSRNRSGRWCSMAVCGNRMKARTFRSRH